MSEDFDEKAFNDSLPKGLRHAIFFSSKDMPDLALKCNALIGRVYSNKETGEGFYVSGIKQVLTATVQEFLLDGESDLPKPVIAVHTLVLPEFEEIRKSLPDSLPKKAETNENEETWQDPDSV